MGEVVRVHCLMCRKEWECMTGCGLNHGKKENIIDAFPKNEQIQITEWMKKSHIPLYDFRYQIASCDFCNSLISIPVLRGIDDNEIFVGACPTCGNKVSIPLSETVSDITCPSCQNRSLMAEEVGHWD